MKHVLIDRPRTGGDGGKSKPPKGSKKRFQKTPLDEQPKFASSARHRVYGWNAKELNDHIAPLRRWLRSQVGRDWDDVWSEVCENLSTNGVATKHVRDHVEGYVEQNCIIVDGEVCDSRGMGLKSWRGFYVHPETNVLCCHEDYRRYRRRKYKADWLEGKDEDHRYYLLKGIWYEVTLKPLPKTRIVINVYDVVMAAQWERTDKKYIASSGEDCTKYYGRKVYAASKRQLGKRDIQKLKLWESELAQD